MYANLLEDFSRIEIEHLRRKDHTTSALHSLAKRCLEHTRERTWTRPESSPATSKFPSFLISPPRAVSLNRVTVLTTLLVRGAWSLTSAPAVTASLCGREGAKWTWVMGANDLTYVGWR